MNHHSIRRAAMRPGNAHLERWTRREQDYLLLSHHLELPLHHVWEIGPEPLERVLGLVLAESKGTGEVLVTSADPDVVAWLIEQNDVPDYEIPRVCFELLRVIGSSEAFVPGFVPERVAERLTSDSRYRVTWVA